MLAGLVPSATAVTGNHQDFVHDMNGQCMGLDFSYRLDRAEVLAWITNPNRPAAG